MGGSVGKDRWEGLKRKTKGGRWGGEIKEEGGKGVFVILLYFTCTFHC